MVNLTIVRKMCESINYSQIVRTVFGKCVDSVKPRSLLNSQKIELVLPNTVRVGDECIGTCVHLNLLFVYMMNMSYNSECLSV